jgi:hypothetical protein
MTPRLPKLEPPNRPPALPPDWVVAATEARRRRDDTVKQGMADRERQRRQEREAWSPVHENPRGRHAS